MAAVHSLGLHKPSALDHLVHESLLPLNPSPDSYTWEIYADSGVEEELLSTKTCVVWSQGRIVRKLFNFSIEQEQVHHAKLAWFHDDDERAVQRLDENEAQPPKKRRSSGFQSGPKQYTPASKRDNGISARALVVFLKYQAHVFFLSGASHIVNLPFEVERAFPAPRGLIIQRKLSNVPTALHLSLSAPAPPQNSFLSPLSQVAPWQFASFLSPAARKAPQIIPGLDFDLLQAPATPADDGLPRHYSFTSPLSELALIVRTTGIGKSRKSTSSLVKTLSALDLEEDIIYVTSMDETFSEDRSTTEPLTLMVTLNQTNGLYSLWHASYIGTKPVSKLLTGASTPTIGAKSRRRSSFVTATGASTPAARPRDSVRESMGVVRNKAASGKAAPGTNKKTKKARSSKASKVVEESLAAQVDPDFEPRHTARESRRVSSMLSRADLSASFDRNAFQDLASQSGVQNSFGHSGRRGQSLGAGERQSFGAGSFRRLRASTPGTFSQLSIEDLSENGTAPKVVNGSQASTTMDEFDHYVDLEMETGDTDDVNLQNPLYGLKKELLVRKFAEIPAPAQIPTSSTGHSLGGSNGSTKPTVFTVASPLSCDETGDYGRRFFLIIFDKSRKECIQVEYSVRNKLSRPATSFGRPDDVLSKTVPLPSFRAVTHFDGIIDAIALPHRQHSRVLYLKDGRGIQSNLWVYSPWSPEILVQLPTRRVRIFNPHDVGTVINTPRGVGAKRRASLSKILTGIRLSGSSSALDILSNEGKHHQIKLSLWPKNSVVARLLKACFFVMPLTFGEKLLALWWNRNLSYQKMADGEWHALVVSIFALFLSCEEERKSRRQQRRLTEVVEFIEGDSSKIMEQLQSSWNSSRDLQGAGWSWTKELAIIPGSVTSSPKQTKELPVSPKQFSKENFSNGHIAAARAFIRAADCKDIIENLRKQRQALIVLFPRLVVATHLVREETKLSNIVPKNYMQDSQAFGPMIVQLARWLGWPEWDWKAHKYYSFEALSPSYTFEDSTLFQDALEPQTSLETPPSVLQWIESASSSGGMSSFPTFETILSVQSSPFIQAFQKRIIPRISVLKQFYSSLQASQNSSAEARVEAMMASGISSRLLETFSEATVVILKESIVQSQARPPTTWSSDILSYISREDLKLVLEPERLNWTDSHSGRIISNEGVRDLHSISQSSEIMDPIMSFPNSERMAVSRLIFNQDRRFAEAVHMIEPYRIAVAECVPEPGWSEGQVLEAQREVHNWVMTRTFSLAPGLGFAHFDSRVPLLSEKFNIHGYNTLCVMKPMNNTVSVDRTMFTEEKYAWAWFHSGVAAGLSIAKHAEGIDSSWIVFNRPAELNNRHAGLLLALGLNGHLSAMAKWLAFKYLTPKHTMTSIGLLLGLSASHIGTMDTLVTRLLSVHVTRMLPPGAAELNLSSLTQTAGLMGIGLLYYNTQHRRMSEVMLSEIENLDTEDLSGASEPVRDESYRLAAGFALGLINLGQGSDLKGLHDLRLVERLLAVAVGPRPVNLIHLMDQATAGATIALMLVFMKTENKAVARKIDVPDTVPQFDFVRPDILLLRTLAKHLIMWNEIRAEHKWILKNLPREYTKHFKLENVRVLRSDHMPFYNILAGLLWAISLKFAGTGDESIRDFLIGYLDQFIRICRLPAQRYDSKLTRNAVRNCQDLVALAGATVMAGTGDLALFRRLRSLHGRVNPETPYGSHMAGHMALGALFFGAGCYTFGTSNLAIASLIAAFYPVFPMDVTDNKAHLQAFRHFWALAAEARCIIPRDIDTQRTISLDLMVHFRDGSSQRITAPKLLPELATIAKIETISSEFWPVTLDMENNPAHFEAFRKNQTLHVRRRPAHEAHTSTFTATLLALNEARSGNANASDWIFRLPAFSQFEMADVGMFLDPEERGGALLDVRGSAVDERLSMGATAERGWDRDSLWNLRILLRWADRRVLDGEKDLKWIRKEVLDRWKAILERRARQSGP